MSDSDSDTDEQRHETWREKVRDYFQWQLRHIRNRAVLRRHVTLRITRQILMLLTLEPLVLESLRQTLQAVPSDTIRELDLNWEPFRCRNPPTEDALEATARQLIHIMHSLTSLSALSLHNVPDSLTSFSLTAFTQLHRLQLESCPLTTATVRSIFSIRTLKQLEMRRLDLSSIESITAFCRGMSTTSLQELSMESMVIPPEHDAHLATTLARCNTLLQLICTQGTSLAFYDQYCAELLNNVDSQLEWLHLFTNTQGLDHHGAHGATRHVEGPDTEIVARIRLFLDLNAERRKHRPLFAAIGDAETDVARRQGLVEAFETVSIPVAFAYIRSNPYNLITLIQELGQSETV